MTDEQPLMAPWDYLPETGKLEQAIIMASAAHCAQVDKGGLPYILHPLRIMAKMGSEQARIVAVLHDVVEDTIISLEQIERAFGGEIAAAVDALTRRPDEPYMDFIDRAGAHPIALEVKLADVRDNMDLSRLGRKPLLADRKRHNKYFAARNRLVKIAEAQAEQQEEPA